MEVSPPLMVPLPPPLPLPVLPPPPPASLYVGDLHPDVTQFDLTRLFGEIGPLASVRLCRNREFPYNSLCYAYVNFSYHIHAQMALGILNHSMLKGKSMRVMWCQKDLTRNTGSANLFVKNLDSSITSGRLQTIFSKYGTIISCKVAEENGKSKGFGFVQYDSEDSAFSAIGALHESFLEGKQLYVSKFIKKSERNNACEESEFRNLYVKNLSEDVTEDLIQGRFSEFGNIASLAIMKDGAGKSKGFGFVEFKSHEDAKKAMEALNGAVIGSKRLYVGKAQKKAERQGQLGYANKEVLNYHSQKLKSANLFINNLNISIDDIKLEQIFSAFGNVISAKVMRYDNGFSKKFGFVNFADTEEAKKALESLNGTVVEGELLYVAVSQSSEGRRKTLQYCFPPIPPQPLYSSNCSVYESPLLSCSYTGPFFPTTDPASHTNSSQPHTNEYNRSHYTFAAHSYGRCYSAYVPKRHSQQVKSTTEVSVPASHLNSTQPHTYEYNGSHYTFSEHSYGRSYSAYVPERHSQQVRSTTEVSVPASHLNSSQPHNNEYNGSHYTISAHSYGRSYSAYVPKRHSQQVTSTTKVSINQHQPGHAANVTGLQPEKNKYGTQKVCLSPGELAAQIGKAVKARQAHLCSGKDGHAKPAKYVCCLNY